MRVSERGQVTIPKKLRKQCGLDKNVEVEIVLDNGRLVIQKRPPERHPVDKVRGIIKLRFGKNVDDYIEQVRGR